MKKLVSVILAGLMVVSLAACGSNGGSTASSTAASSSAAEAKITKVEDLKGKTVGVQTGTTGDIYISDDKDLAVGTVERYNKGAEAVLALTQGKIDAVVIDNEPAKTFVAQNKGLKILETEYVTEDYAIAISKDKKDLTEKVNKAMAELKADGTLDKIVKYYIYNDEKDRGERYKSTTGNKGANGTLVMATNAAFPPYEFMDNNEVMGIDADMAQAIADKLGMTLKIEDMEFDSIITAVQAGKADMGVAGMTVTEDRLKMIDFSDSYYTGKQVVIAVSYTHLTLPTKA